MNYWQWFSSFQSTHHSYGLNVQPCQSSSNQQQENRLKMKISRRIFLCLKKGKTKWKTATKTRCKKQTNFCMTCDRIIKQKEVNWSNIPKNCCKDKAPPKTLAQLSIQSNRHSLFQDYKTKTPIKHFCLRDY